MRPQQVRTARCANRCSPRSNQPRLFLGATTGCRHACRARVLAPLIDTDVLRRLAGHSNAELAVHFGVPLGP